MESPDIFPFITRKRGCNQPTDRKTGLTVTAPIHYIITCLFCENDRHRYQYHHVPYHTR